MKIEQIHGIVNDVLTNVTQGRVVLETDLSNLVTIGEEVINADWKDNYVRGITDRIGREVFVARVYKGRLPSVLMDSWEYGSIKRKIRVKGIPTAKANDSWALKRGEPYDPNVFNAPDVSEKFFNHMTTFEIDISITDHQIKESFLSPMQMNAFISMIWTWVENGMTLAYENLIKATINGFIADTVYTEFPDADYSSKSGVRAINLLKEYNNLFKLQLSVEEAWIDPDFIRYASFRMSDTIGMMSAFTTMFNIEGTEKFTPAENLHVVLLERFNSAAKTYLYADTFHDSFVHLKYNETVPFWQGTGADFGFDSVSKIHVKSPAGNEVEIGGILGVMFDHESLGVMRMNRRSPTGYNPKGEFYNYFNKADAEFFNDHDENFVVFFMA